MPPLAQALAAQGLLLDGRQQFLPPALADGQYGIDDAGYQQQSRQNEAYPGHGVRLLFRLFVDVLLKGSVGVLHQHTLTAVLDFPPVLPNAPCYIRFVGVAVDDIAPSLQLQRLIREHEVEAI